MGDRRKRVGVRAESDTSCTIDFPYKGVRCRERVKIAPTPAGLTRAERFRAAILHAIEQGTFNYAETFPDSPRRFQFMEQAGAGYPLATWLETWVERKRPHLKASTWDDYRKIVYNTLIPAFGHHFLPDLKRTTVREWCNGQASSNKRLSNVQSVLRASLQDALDDDLLDVNPLHGWRYARKEAPKREDDVDPFSQEEQTAILAACADPQHRNLFRFAFWTGMRTSELCALEWGDVDFVRGIVRVSRALTQAADEAEEPKTRRSARDVKLLDPALQALADQKPLTFLLSGGAVFRDPRTGEPWTGDQPIRHGAWTHALKLAGVRYRRPYQTRHTYASMMLTAGESPVWVAQQMGHADLTMISRRYGRWMSDAAPEAGNRAVMLFGKADEKVDVSRSADTSLPKTR